MRKTYPMSAVFFLTLSAITMGYSAYADGAHPQGIRLDGTLGSGGKPELPGPDYQIKAEFGKQAGSNLFHSFERFNIHQNESATFSGPDSVRSIISRVTGGSASWIDGKLASSVPDADLYFLNPAGVMFGANASLDLQGSFHVSTADYLRMGENDRFYAATQANEQLSVEPLEAFGFLGAPASVLFTGSSLTVPDGKTMSVIGSDIELKGAGIRAPGGRINLAAAGSAGEVVPNASGLETSSQQNGRISLSDNSTADASGAGGGSIFIRSGVFVASDSIIKSETLGDQNTGKIAVKSSEISFQGESYISGNTHGAGMGGEIALEAREISFQDGARMTSNTFGKGGGGNITLKADQSVTFDGENSKTEVCRIEVTTRYPSEGAGNGGHLHIEADTVSFINGAYINSGTYGKGNAGNVGIRANDTLNVSGALTDKVRSGIIATVVQNSTGGNGGNIDIQAKNVRLYNGGVVDTSSFGTGAGGSTRITASGQVCIEGAAPRGEASGLYSQSKPYQEGITGGSGGSIFVSAGELILRDGGLIVASSVAPDKMKSSDGGDITIDVAGQTTLTGVNPYGENKDGFGSGIYARSKGVGANAGDAGKITLKTGSLKIGQGAVIESGSDCNAKGGDIDIAARDTVLISGDASGIPLKPPASLQQYFLEEFKPEVYNRSESGIYSGATGRDTDAGNGGAVHLSASWLGIADNGRISATTAGPGNAGSIFLEAGSVDIGSASSVASSSNSTGEGGNAGSITVGAKDSIRLFGNSRITTSSSGNGNGGKTVLEASDISVRDGAYIESAAFGKGNGGNITLKAEQSVTFDGENSESEVPRIELTTRDMSEGAGHGGELEIDANTVSFINGAYINSSTYGKGNAGNVTIRANDTLNVSGALTDKVRSGIIATVVQNSTGGNGGNIDIQAKNVRLYNGGVVDTSTFGTGTGGSTRITASGEVCIEGAAPRGEASGLYSQSKPYQEGITGGSGGSIFVSAGELTLRDGGLIVASSVAPDKMKSSDGGDITIDVAGQTTLTGVNPYGENKDGFGSGIYARSKGVGNNAGNAGKITLKTGSLKIGQGAVIESGSDCNAKGGDIDIAARDNVLIFGDASSIPLKPPALLQKYFLDEFRPDVYNRSESGIYSRTEGKDAGAGQGGIVHLSAPSVRLSDNGKISTTSEGPGNAGSIAVDAGRVDIDSAASVASSSNSAENGGEAGIITVRAKDSIRLFGNSQITTEADSGGGGKIITDAVGTVFLDNARITSSVYHGEGNGGDIEIGLSIPRFVILNHAKITAYAEEGDGGAIFISAENYIRSSDSAVAATSKRGNDGTVKIEAPDLDLSTALTVLPSNFLDATRWIKMPCSSRGGETSSRFVIRGRDAMPSSVNDLQASELFWLEEEDSFSEMEPKCNSEIQKHEHEN